jgi:hypothetical protein
VFLDCSGLKIRDGGSVQRRALYLALGVTLDSERHVLGMSSQETTACIANPDAIATRRSKVRSALFDGHDDDRAVVLERFCPAVGDRVLDRHGGTGGRRAGGVGDRVLYSA